MSRWFCFLSLVAMFLLSACGPTPIGSQETETPLAPTHTPLPSVTPTPLPSATSEPTSTPTMTFTPEPTATPTITPTATRVMGEEVVLLQGGFSFRTPVGFRRDVYDDFAILYTNDYSVMIQLDAFPDIFLDVGLPFLAQDYLDTFNEAFEDVTFTLGEPAPYRVSGVEGLIFPLKGGEMRGELVVVEPNDYSLFFALGMWHAPEGTVTREKRGREAFRLVLEHIVFLE
jgi:hypothetical protein